MHIMCSHLFCLSLFLASSVAPVLSTVVWSSQTSVTVDWPYRFCRQYVLVYYSLTGKDGIVAASSSRAVLNDLNQDTYIAFVICSSYSEGYIVNGYAPIKLSKRKFYST